MARLTLARMAERGLTDHLGGGFFRYCVDERWEIPHFEKMLYDNAQLLPLYSRAAVEFDEPTFADAANACARWISREMTAPHGAFWSSLDADSDGEEGLYYVWQLDEIRNLLSANEFAAAQARFGLDRPPNFEGHAWHLQIAASIEEVAVQTGLAHDEVGLHLATARQKLFEARSLRVRPGLDDKILTAWNALAIAGAARSARRLASRPLLAEAIRALDFLHENVWREGHLYACHAGGNAKFPAYLDDHAFLLDALLAMLQIRWSRRDLDWAIELADALLDRFEDGKDGGFFFTGNDAENLPQRPKPFMDDSLPSGNGVAARALLRLGHLLARTRYLDAAERALRAAWSTLTDVPHACCSMLLALDEFLDPSAHVVVRYREEGATRPWRELLGGHAGAIDAYFIPVGEALSGVLAAQDASSPVVAYLCKGTSCDPPLTSVEAFAAVLQRLI
jgi:uncharacterized protein YyaL (SSP411 family)